MKLFELLRWGFAVPVKTREERLIILAYVKHANLSTLVAWPSLDELERLTLIHRDTISATRKELGRRGVLVDTGQRRGYHGSVTVYRLSTRERSVPQSVDKTIEQPGMTGSSGNALPSDCGSDPPVIAELTHPECPSGSNRNISTEHVHGARAREEVPGGKAAELPEQVPRIVEGLEHPIEKLKRDLPHLFKNAPPATAAEDPT